MQSKIATSMIRVGLALGFFLGLSTVLRAGGPEGSKEVARLLSEARTNAHLVSWAAAEMEQFRFSRVGWETHTFKLTEIREMVNRTARTVARLNDLKSEASPAQRQEIDRITRALGPVVATMEATLGHLRENQQDIDNCVQKDPQYKSLLRRNAELAERLASEAQRRG